ncbi:VOC family protein [Hyphomicrobium sp. CS1GBMeth3]|uniref:VOC family protein n=1 Tax=Hyphomicrobium sp. CS1GBMeth3 TaxID=1892845 RepID=UPI000931A2F5|nr:VOC family protein [Hyphomicrobium sp. CS1GBMeth3]
MGSELTAKPLAVLESILYTRDLGVAEAFYNRLLGREPYARVDGRHIFYKLESQMLLIFNPEATRKPPAKDGLPLPPHGAEGQGHICFAASASDIDHWRDHLADMGVAIEADFEWPNGGRSIYFRDPDGNSIEFAEPRIWGFEA